MTDSDAALALRWHDAYLPVADGHTEFGILARAGWLHEKWAAGKVAFVCGVLNNGSRDHELAQRTLEMGIRDANKVTFGSGWGGRLAQAANANVVALTNSPRRFTFGPNLERLRDLTAIDKRRLIPAANMREIALPDMAPGTPHFDQSTDLKRGLKQYYAERRSSVRPQSVYFQFFEHERRLRELGAAIDARLSPVPDRARATRARGAVRRRLKGELQSRSADA